MSSNKTSLRNTTLLKAFQEEQMKVYVEVINPGSDDRPKFIHEAHADTEDSQECLKTVFVYIGTSDVVLYTRESKSTWNGQWDLDAEVAAQAVPTPYSIEG
jgi:hypothetical protein